jgi:uncharacterized protein (TIGR02996 family)
MYDARMPRVKTATDRNPALEAAVLAEPDAREPLLVYADWLQAQHSPHGEVIVLAVAAEREAKKARKLKVNATNALVAYIEEHLAPKFPKLAGRMLGFKLKGEAKGDDGIGNTQSASITWRRGLIDGIHTWLWKPDMRAQMFELLKDRHALLLRELTIRDHAIASLEFLAHLTALESLDFRWGKIEKVADLAPLAKMSRLDFVDVRHSKVRDLSPLRKLPLRKLGLGGTQVEDLAPLAKHPTLECIDLAGTKVSDIGPLLKCPKLCNVSVWDARVSTRDAETLVKAIKQNQATPSPNSDYERYVSHNEASWY